MSGQPTPYRELADMSLVDFLTPIESGLGLHPGHGGLSPERAAQLHARLRALAAARQDAAVSARSYPITGWPT